MSRSLLIGVICWLIVSDTHAAETSTSPVGQQITELQLNDHLGAVRKLSDWSDQKAIVVAFLGTECPLVKLYGPRLEQISRKYADQGVAVVGINSNQHDSLVEIAHFVRTHEIGFPILKDPGNRVADKFAAQRTPEVFLLDDRRVVRYHGLIDDEFGVGYTRAKVGQSYLTDAIDALLAGKPISVLQTEAVGCHIGRVTRAEPVGTITYANQISRILQKRCVHCHRPGQIAPFSLTSYDEVIGWADTIREVIDDRRMPPWHADPRHGKFINDARMPEHEKELIHQWVDNGVPLGDKDQLPDLPEFIEDWAIPRPDVVIKMPRTFRVPASGVVPYKYFTVDPGWTEDKWIRAAEGRPGNRAVVHHLILFYVPPGQAKHRPQDALLNSVAAFAPGMPASSYEGYAVGCARRVPAGSKLVFQMHYTPNGTEQEDQSDVGIVFADPDEIEKELHVDAAFNFRFMIPPGKPDHRVDAEYRFGRDMLLYGLIPHMHLRGKSFRFTAQYPDETREVLLDVPRYDFNWQNIYILAEPKKLPEGTKLLCEAHFDNSEQNLVNPNPRMPVFWGDQTWQEMVVGSFAYSLAEQNLTLPMPQIQRLDDREFAVRFQYKPPEGAKEVFLAGSFNQWKPTGHRMEGPDAEGRFATTLKLAAGRHEYKYVLEGKTWKSDPANAQHAGYYHNSVLDVE